jgi:hypothetical protein
MEEIKEPIGEVKINAAPVGEWHNCHFCGDYVRDGLDPKGERHWLSDCRPDLVEHEIGPLCTWPDKMGTSACYAYTELQFEVGKPALKWTDEHTHFNKDGPM